MKAEDISGLTNDIVLLEEMFSMTGMDTAKIEIKVSTDLTEHSIHRFVSRKELGSIMRGVIKEAAHKILGALDKEGVNVDTPFNNGRVVAG